MSVEPGDLLAQALGAIESLEARLEASERSKFAQIAIVGLGCRFPPALSTPDEYWDALASGRDAVVEIPPGRWSGSPLTTDRPGARYAALLERIDTFDAAFFGIAPREAIALDPQQRLLLEVTWEALEHAGIVPGALKGSDTSVFVGICSADYQHQVVGARRVPLDAYAVTGNMMSTAAGRLSFVFGFQGPCMALDTACSSSLVAIHLACQSLRNADSRTAIAGGVSVILSPRTMEGLAETQALSPDGRSRAFDAAANGFVRGEGCGIVVLKRMEDAIADGDRIWACIRGSAINQDGRSTGLTTPNVLAQQALLKQALTNARVSPHEVGHIEAHGTGTLLGDPIEFEALRSVFEGPRADGTMCPLGSVKTNIGHLEGAAGVAGLMKVVMSLQREEIPRHLHFRALNPHISLDGTPFVLPTTPMAWPRTTKRRIAGVSSFGMSGTNAHMVLEEAPVVEEAAGAEGAGAVGAPLVVSGRDEAAMRAQAGRWAAWLAAHPEAGWAAVVDTAARRRTHFAARAAVVVRDGAAARAALAAVATGTPHPAVVVGQARRGRVAVLFTGQGSQRAGMGRALYEADGVFRAALTAIAAEVDRHLARPLLEVLFTDAEAIQQTAYAQPALFALEVALFRRWQTLGLRVDRLLGHSVGELAAAHVAGVLSLADAAKLVAARGALMQACPGGGAMVAVSAAEADVRPRLAPYGDRVAIAAVNGPAQTVISGDADAVAAVARACEAGGATARRLTVSHAFHSRHMDGMLAAFRALAATCTFQPPQVPLISNVTGTRADARIGTAEYWVEQVRQPVRFFDGLRALVADEVTTVVECGPDGVLCALGARALPDAGVTWVPSVRPADETLARAVAQLHVAGVELDWPALLGAPAGPVDLPAYPFQRARYWLDASDSDTHPLLGEARRVADTDLTLYTPTLSRAMPAWASEHRVLGRTLLPGAAFLEIMLAAGHAQDPEANWNVRDVVLLAPLALDGHDDVRLQITLKGNIAGPSTVRIYSQPIDAEWRVWTLHAEGVVAAAPAADTASPAQHLPPGGARAIDVSGMYEAFEAAGVAYGSSFRGVLEAWSVGEDVWARIALPEDAARSASRYRLHPALLDAAFHTAALGHGARHDQIRIPAAVRRLDVWQAGVAHAWVQTTSAGEPSFTLYDSEGRPVARVEALRWAAADRSRRGLTDQDISRCRFAVRWQPVDAAVKGLVGRWAVWCSDGAMAQRAPIAEVLRNAGASADAVADFGSAATGCDGLVCVWDEPFSPAAAQHLTQRAVALLQATSAMPRPKMVWLTRNAIGTNASDQLSGLAASGLWGLARTARVEDPDRRLSCIDLGCGEDVAGLMAALTLDNEPECAVRGASLLVARLHRATDDGLTFPGSGQWRVEIAERGRLDRLAIVQDPPQGLAPGEVRVAIEAAGVNFRDVLNALGMVPNPFLGFECAGVVTDVGPGVDRFRTGDRVFGLAQKTFAASAVVDDRLIEQIPDVCGFDEAATIPLAFLTAYYALHDLGRLQRGERILIHAAAGGVGMAAVQLARLAGAEIYATASPSKWPALRSAGLPPERIASSRSLDFATAFGEVDVVLNSLAREFVDASLLLIANGGRFLEMGKTDVRDPGWLAAHHPRVRYAAFELVEAGPERLASILSELSALFAAGGLRPLPRRVFAMSRASDALRFMARARHTGKVVLVRPGGSERALQSAGSVLVSGGLGALGRHVARWLVEERRVQSVLLASRRGENAEGAAAFAAELRALGAQATVVACDVADERAVASLVKAHAIRGVIHAAGAIDNGVLGTMTPDRLSRVLAPKIDGAWNLHQQTRNHDLDFFVLFSSIAGTIGSAGQANYAAASTFLDALAHHRRAHGLPATSIAWGPWAGGGMATAAGGVLEARAKQQGVAPLDPQRGLALLDAALGRDDITSISVAFEPSQFQRALESRGLQPPALFRSLVRPTTAAPEASAGFRERLAAASPSGREAMLQGVLAGEVASVLGLSDAADVSGDRAFSEMGADSLMAVEIRNRLVTVLGLDLPATIVFDFPNLVALTKHVLDRWGLTNSSVSPSKQRVSHESEPIAVISMACRFPGGADTPEQLWRLVHDGVDAISEVPATRWNVDAYFDPDPEAAGKTYTRCGGFVGDVDRFDAAFFGIGPAEAKWIDPQQRLLFETTWELFERVGVRPASLAGSDTGVYVGICGHEYLSLGERSAAFENPYSLLGTAHSAIVGRLSYWLGLEGPNVPVDTACSSSLVSLHLAAQALRNGECDLAIAGGVNLLLSPFGHVYFSRLKALSPTGRCRTFSAAADGYVRSEGCGLVLMKRLSDARRDGDRILGQILGSAVNQDGRSNGFTAPNGSAQQEVLRKALRMAAVPPSSVDYVECHGTGTPLGDPIEVHALAAVYGASRESQTPLWLGSIKSNIGHTEAAAGIAGVMKAVLALQHGVIPRSLHADELNPHIPWGELPVQAARASIDWPSRGPRRAAVSSFGMSGTNAHVVLEEAPVVEEAAGAEGAGAVGAPLVVSGRDEAAMRAQAGRWAAWLAAHPEAGWAAVVDTAARRRTHFAARAAVVVRDGAAARAALAAVATGTPHPAVVVGQARRGRVAVLFTGQGSQRAGMGRALYEADGVFRAALTAIAAEVDRHLARPLLEVLFTDAEAIQQTAYAQPALFALEVALFRRWQTLGLRVDRLLGHSVGELAAAHVAGVLSLADAAKLVAARGALMQACPGGGAMVAVSAAEADVRPRLAPYGDRVAIAAVNGPAQTVISGDADAVAAVARACEAGGATARRLTVSHAFHSRHMDGMLAAFRALAATCTFQPPQVPLISNVTGTRADARIGTAEYWVEQVRQPVRFFDGLRALVADEVTTVVECGPDGVLCALGARALPDAGVTWVPSVRPADETLARAVAQLHVAGVELDWPALLGAPAGLVDLPAYPFQRARYWLDAPAADRTPGATPVQRSIYSLGWRRLPASTAPATYARGSWFLSPARGGVADVVAAALESFGATVVRSSNPDVLASGAYRGAIHACDPSDGEQPIGDALEFFRAGARSPARPTCWVVTHGAVSVDAREPLTSPAGAAVWGLGRVFSLEHADRCGALIDLSPSEFDPAALISILTGERAEDHVALRPSGTWVQRVMPYTSAVAHSRSAPWTTSKSVLITGGVGALGLHLARRLAARGVPRLVLTSRRGLVAPGVEDAVAELERLGSRVIVAAVDVADAVEMDALLRAIDRDGPDLGAIFHVAGVEDRTPLTALTIERLHEVLRPKVLGAEVLDALAKDRALDAFVVFSSIASVWGSDHASAYAAANAYADGLIARRRAAGLPGLSVNFGPWSGSGMATPESQAWLQRRGIAPLRPDDALDALDALLADDQGQAVVASVDWARFRGAYEAVRPRRLVADLPGAPAAASQAAEAPQFAKILGSLDDDQRRVRVRDWIRSAVAHLLNTKASDVDPAKGFFDHGMDSVMAAELRVRIESELGARVRSTAAFDHPTVEELTAHVLTLLAPGAAVRASIAPATVTGRDEPIAVIGLGCRFPARADDPEAFWTLLAAGADAVVDVPKSRWDADQYYDPDPESPGKTYTRQGAFLDRIDAFDPAFFGISAREARDLDPRQRLLLEVTWEALERARLVPGALANSRTGVFVGIEESEYGHDALDLQTLSAYSGLGRMVSTAAGRLSYVLGLQGPSLAVNTACSSSLVAVHLACQSLLSGECDLALAGGVALMMSPASFVALSKARALSRDGRCKTFSASADGYGRGEGCGVVVLKRRSDAQSAGDDIALVIRGSAVAHDGRSSGLTVPNGLSQRRVLREALSRARLSPSDVQYVECHGTGTALGDPIEVEAVADVYAADRTRPGPILLGAAKTNVGHLEAASGMVGLLKIALALRHGAIPPTIHASDLSPHIPWRELAVEVVTDLRPWTSEGRPRRAGLSAFGISGTNAHLILEEPPAFTPNDVASAPRAERLHHLITLSARTDGALREQARRLAHHVAAHGFELGDVAHALATTRTAFECRLAFPVSDSNAAVERLIDFAGGKTAPTLSVGRVAERTPTVAFLFSGQASQYPGMARQLYEREPVFRAAIDRCADGLGGTFAPGLKAVLDPDWVTDAFDDTTWSEQALFAVEFALTELWRSWGIEPACLLGRGVGECVAACIAGVVTLDDALRLVAARGRLMQAPQEMALAASAIEEHAPQAMGPSLADFEAVVRSLNFSAPAIPLVSQRDGQLAGDRIACAEYWIEQVQDAAGLDHALETLLEAGITKFVEIAPDSELYALGAACDARGAASWHPSLRRGRDDHEMMFETLASLWTSGQKVAWDGVDAPWPRRKVPLPTYPFARESFWLESRQPRDRTSSLVDATFWNAVSSGQAERVLSLLFANSAVSDATRAAMPDFVRALASYHASGQTGRPAPALVYTPVWRRVPRLAADLPLTGDWLLCTDDRHSPGVTDRITSALQQRGAFVQRVTSAEGVAAALEKTRVRGLVSAWGLDSPEFSVRPIAATLHTLRAAAGAASAPLCWIATSGAVSTGADDAITSPGAAALWGLGRAFALEHPQLWGGLRDLVGANLDEAEIAGVFAPLVGDDHLAVRPDGLWSQRLLPYAPPARGAAPAVSGTALVTGGVGALGLHVARWLARRGVERLVLTGRRELTAAVQASIQALGCSVMVVHADAGDRTAMAEVLRQIASSGPPLRSIFHLAGVLDDGLLVNQTGQRLEAVLKPKAAGAWNLHELTRDVDLKAFVMFSSLAAALGSAGQTSYAAANAFLDGLAAFRREQGLPALSIGWGPWAGDGMSARVAGRRLGLEPLDPGVALGVLEELLADSPAHAVVADVSWPIFRKTYESGGVRPLLSDLPGGAASPAGDGTLLESLARLSPPARTAAVLDGIRKELAGILGASSPESIDPRKGFADMGLDSLMALELRARVRSALGITLSATAAFDHPTPDRLTRFVVSELFGAENEAPMPTAVDPLARVAQLKDDEAMQRIDEIIADLES